MKKVLMMKKIFFLMLSVLVLNASAEIVYQHLPELPGWEKSADARLVQNGKFTILKQGKLSLPELRAAEPGDTVVVTLLYTGKGKLKLELQELDEKQAETHKQTREIVNPAAETHSRSVCFDLTGKGTRSYRLNVLAEENANLGLHDIAVRRMTGEESALYSPERNRKLWAERTAGKNLARGLKVSFDPEPNYELTRKGKTDEADLTDGIISTRYGEYIWFDPLAAGWSTRANQCQVKMDLQSLQNISRAVIRICGGRRDPYHGSGMFPSLFQVWISRDGKQWYCASRLKKVNINEKADADWKTLYYLPELSEGSAPPYVYPFELEINAEARYLAFIFSKATPLLYLDEIALLEGNRNAPGFNRAYSGEPSEQLFRKDASIVPYYPEVYINRGKINLPNWFKFDDRRAVKEGGLSYFIDLPAGIVYDPDKGSYPTFLRNLVKTETRDGRTIRYFRCNYREDAVRKEAARCHIGPFYFRAEKPVPEKECYIRIGTTAGTKNPQTVIRQFPVKLIDIPEVAPSRHLYLTFPWFSQAITFYWPGYIDTLRHLGVNGTGWHNRKKENGKEFFAELKKHRIDLIAVPQISILKVLGGKTSEYRCTNGKSRLCPALRGPLYEKYCNAFAECLEKIPAERVHLDDELWTSPGDFTGCSRCNELRKAKNMSWSEYAEWVMADSYAGILRAVRKAKPQAKIGSYMYCLDRMQTVYGKSFPIFGTAKLFPALLDEVQTPYYGPNPVQVTRRVRSNFQQVRDPSKITVYLTGGSGAYYTDRMGDLIGWQLLEAYMNGAGCIAYYIDLSFSSPVDFMHMARAMKAIRPYDEFLMKAELIPDFSGSAKTLNYTGRKLGNKALCLIGNYHSGKTVRTVLPLKGILSVKDCFTGKAVPFAEDGITLDVPGGKGSLIEICFR